MTHSAQSSTQVFQHLQLMFISEAGSHYIELWLTSEIHLLRLKAYTTTPNLHFVLWGVEETGGVETLSGCAYVYLELGT